MNRGVDWERRRLKYVCDVNPAPPRVDDVDNVTFVPMESVGEHGGIDTSLTRAAGTVKQGYTGFQDGDVVIAELQDLSGL